MDEAVVCILALISDWHFGGPCVGRDETNDMKINETLETFNSCNSTRFHS